MTRILLVAAFVGSVLAANVVTSQLGLIPAGFGLLVPAGTYLAGLALGLRDALHDSAGVRWVLPAIAAAAALSFAISDPRIAIASATAFLVAELADLAVYTPIRRHGWTRAAIASNAIGAVFDTVLFLWIAGFPLTTQSVGGQILVKACWVTVPALALMWWLNRRREAAPCRT